MHKMRPSKQVAVRRPAALGGGGDYERKKKNILPRASSGVVSDVLRGLLRGTLTLAASITAISAALYIVAPQFAPRDSLGAELDRVGIAQGIDYGGYQRQQYEEIDPAATVPRESGIVVTVHAKLSAFQDRSYTLNLTPYEAKTNIPIPPQDSLSSFVSTCENKSPKAQEDNIAWRCWLIAPPEGLEYFIRVELLDGGPTKDIKSGPVGHQDFLDFIDSDVFISPGIDYGNE